ncbi:hypothetical protein [Allosphingosinicella sp.]|uniref:hypothetical protein n=1 Tax=Allosphingosinicella sp. TaxID=2823234 RepID=UPI002FC1E96E
MKPGARRQTPVFAIPAIIAIATLIGLVGGLVGDGAADLVSWLALGSCLVTIGWSLRKRA